MPLLVISGLSGKLNTNKGPIMATFDDTKPDGSAPAICGFMAADHARDLMHLTEEQR